jgi:hypothetical protein
VTVALPELPAGIAEIAGYVIRRCHLYRNVSPRQILKKETGTPAVVVGTTTEPNRCCVRSALS